MSLIQLPPEIFRHICESCETKAALASLARTDSACQVEAEAVLYQNVTDICLSTLASNPRKAKLVRRLIAGRVDGEEYVNRIDQMHTRMGYLSDALRNTTELRVLWIDIDFWAMMKPPEGWSDEMNRVLCGTTYNQLHTFYFNVDNLDIDRIVDNLTSLKTLVADHQFANKLVEIYRRTLSARSKEDESSSGLCIYTHRRTLNTLGIFPGLQSHSGILQTLHRGLIEPPAGSDDFLWTGAAHRIVHTVQIYLVDTALSREIQKLIQDLTKIVSPRNWFGLDFLFEHPVEIEPKDMKETLSLLPELTELQFLPFLDAKPLPSIPMESGQAQADEVCPDLESVTFIDDHEVSFIIDMNLFD
ncbi:hypothetical protein D9613_007207 [Agrocybe pediades]|uniref:Uncharacterized protein n=1 Tax=Agrocybe pediades TaxID=84607 RepID=A0A8H4QHF5_9AGAR|nr:hypothetical protein D9613_007207 [Agrocybe pediades]